MNREYSRSSIRISLALSCLTILVLALLPAKTAAAQDGRWYAEFFANQTLSGSPILTQFDDAVSFDWGAGSPGSGVPADNFSARWTRTEWFEGGTFRFYARADDGFRLWVGDMLVMDDWYDQQGGWVTRDLYLGQGAHQMRAEYYEHDGAALVQLNWERITGGQGWQAEYFGNRDLRGSPAVSRTDAAIDFSWAYDAPAEEIPPDRFSVRWTHSLGFTPGTYRFLTSTDDGVRLWVDDQLLVDAWYNQELPNTHSGDITLGEGLHHVKVEYFEEGGEAHAHVWWQLLSSAAPEPEPAGWRGEYYDNRYLSGGPALVRDDSEISFDWGTAPPVSWMPDDNFSVRWTRQIAFDPGYYRFSVRSDDGVRVWLDDALIIEKWEVMNYELHYVDGIYLSGSYRFKVEYFERNGNARIHFWVGPASTPSQPSGSMARGPWQAEYYDGTDLAGTPLLVRQDAEIDFDWRFGSPDPAVPAERFSVRWTATLDFPAGRYQFATHTDDGVRLLLDGRLIIENWWPMRGYQYAAVDLPAGQHTLVMEYYERTEAALAQLSWIWLGDSLGAATPL